MVRMRGLVRIIAGLFVGLFVGLWTLGCEPYRGATPVLTQMSPSTGDSESETLTTITGENFRVALMSYLDGESVGEANDTFAASLDSTSLLTVSFINETTLSATVPAGMTPGAYTLSVTDPSGNVAHLPSAFTVVCNNPGPGCWSLAECNRRIELTFDGFVPTENLLDVPVLVRLTPGRVDYDEIMDDGRDIRFMTADSAQVLDHEIERWVDNGQSDIWVRVPIVNGGAGNDRVWMYYDCATDAANDPQAVWDASYLGVWHMSGAPDDSTQWGHDGTPSSIADIDDSAQTVIAGAKQLSGAEDSFISVADVPELGVVGDLSLSVWINYDSLIADEYGNAIVTRANSPGNPPASGNYPYWLNLESDGTIRAYWEFGNNGFVDVLSTTPVISTAGTWYHIVMVRDATAQQVTFYVDGAPLGEPVDYSDNPTAGESGTLYFGRSARSAGFEFSGRLDELRIGAVARSAAWVSAQYATARDDFISYGVPEQRP